MTTIRSGAPRIPPATPSATNGAQPKSNSTQSAATGYPATSTFSAAAGTRSSADLDLAQAKKLVGDKLENGEMKDAINALLNADYPSEDVLSKGLGTYAALKESGALSDKDLLTIRDAVSSKSWAKFIIDNLLSKMKEIMDKVTEKKGE
jgi:hypothetical protein